MIEVKRRGLCAVLLLALLLAPSVPARAQENPAQAADDYIKWVDFSIPSQAMQRALSADIESRGEEHPAGWIEVLSILGTRYGGNWNHYKAGELDEVVRRLREGASPDELLAGYKNYDYYHAAYEAVLGGMVGAYFKEVPDADNPGLLRLEERYGLKAYSPIAEGYAYSHYRDFGNSRSYGYRRVHLGNDLTGSIGTPITAVEGGIIEEIGWNQYGGWRIGIRSYDRRRYYYYAHLRRDHPYAAGLEKGTAVQAGDVIGYLGMTGYSRSENVNGMKIPHLHFGLQLIFDESQKDGVNQIWVDVYEIVELLKQNRATVYRLENGSKDYERKYHIFDEHYCGGEY